MNDTNNTAKTQSSTDSQQLPLWLQQGGYIKTDIDYKTIKTSQKVMFLLVTTVYLPLLSWILIRKKRDFYRGFNGVAYKMDPESSMYKVIVFVSILGTVVYAVGWAMLVLYLIAITNN